MGQRQRAGERVNLFPEPDREAMAERRSPVGSRPTASSRRQALHRRQDTGPAVQRDPFLRSVRRDGGLTAQVGESFLHCLRLCLQFGEIGLQLGDQLSLVLEAAVEPAALAATIPVTAATPASATLAPAVAVSAASATLAPTAAVSSTTLAPVMVLMMALFPVFTLVAHPAFSFCMTPLVVVAQGRGSRTR